jgi:hypothetical protein
MSSRSWRGRVAALATLVALSAGAALPSSALAFNEYFGGGSLCGSNCYIQSGGAHTFILDEGWSSSGSPALACQLFNEKGVNEVTHGGGYCNVGYFGGAYVWARVYNQSGGGYTVTGYAET